MTSKHTPGPWSIERAPGLITIGGAGSGNIVHVLRGLDGAQDANARLISESPAMLEALRELKDAITFNGAPEIHVKGHIVNRISAILSRIDGKE